MSSLFQLRTVGLLHTVELEEGIDFHHLRAVDGIMCRWVNLLEYFFRHPLGAGIAIADWVAQKVTVFVDESEIHSPGIDGDAIYLETFGSCYFQPRLHILEEGEEVPIYVIA